MTPAPYYTTWDDLFSNSNTALCPITSCSIHDAENCVSGSSTSSAEDIKIESSSPWRIEAAKTNAAGYSHEICILCSNGEQEKSLVNWKITQILCDTDLKALLE